uniref:Cyclin B n=1 Tax=Penaeus vannamei TaxID=6689 RepID=B6ECP5_PENVA|nr:cyclin B [Penaeus vannamei]
MIPTNRQITPETPLDSLTLDELDQLLSEKLVTLQVDLLKTYEQQLREHEETLDHLHRHRRAISLPPRPTIGQDDWHSYVYDTRPSREIASVTDLVTINFTNVHTVVDIFPVALDNIHAIYKLDSGNGYILQDDTMHLLTVRNQWTKSPTGCSCPGQASDTRCACCALGSVLCQVSASGVSNTCVEDSQINSHTCSSQSPRSLELDNAIAFEYHTYSEGVQQVVVIAKGENIHFYRLDKWGLQDFHSLKGHNTINLDSPVTHLGYGEMFVEQFGTVTRKRYLFTFGLDSSSKRYYEIVTNPQDFSIETGLSMMWDTTGTSMKVWQNGGRVIIGVQDGTNLNIHELTSDRWGRQQISLQQVLSLPAGVTSWRSYATGFENFLIATTLPLPALYLTVATIDRFLQTQRNIPRNKLQLVGVTAMFIASKYEEMYCPEIGDFAYITDKAYSKAEIRKMEVTMLNELGFNVSYPLPFHFLRRNSKAGSVDASQHTLAKYLMELCLPEYSMCHYKSSIIAASALCLSLKLLDGNNWSDTLTYYSRYTEEQLLPVMCKMASVVVKSSSAKQQAVRQKYKASKLMKISEIPQLKSKLINTLAEKSASYA